MPNDKESKKSLDADAITSGAKVSVPGKIPRTGALSPKSPTGDDYIDNGAVCDDKEGSPECFLNGRQRGRLVGALQQRIEAATRNYQLAAQSVKMEELVKEEEELPLFARILIDLVGLYVVGKLAHSLSHLKKGSAAALKDIAKDVKQTGAHSEADWYEHAHTALVAINDEHIKENIESSLEGVRERAGHGLQKKLNHGEEHEKKESVSFLDYLTNTSSLGFAKIRERLPAACNDAELVTAWNAFDEEDHSFAAYKQALTEKLERYKKSGVLAIRQSAGVYDTGETDQDGRPVLENAGTFVVWNTYLSGHPKQLVYSFGGHSNTVNNQISHGAPAGRTGGYPGMLGTPSNRWVDGQGKTRFFGLNADKDSVFQVPDEFAEVAIARHQLAWGQPVGTEMIDDSDPLVWGPERAKLATDNKVKRWGEQWKVPLSAPKPAAPDHPVVQLGKGPAKATPILSHDTPPDFLKVKKNVSVAGDDPSKDL